MLYLHEIIDIIGTGQEAYLDTVGERAVHSEREGISRLVGTWKVIGSTNRWPRVVNLWEKAGSFLSGKCWRSSVSAQCTQWRSGGFDRILEPSVFSPTRDQLRARQLKAWVCVHTIVRLFPGKAGEYLTAVGDLLSPLLEARGLTLMGAYTVPMRSDEVLVLWAAPDFHALCALYDRRRSDAGLHEWTALVAPLRQQFDTMWLVPSTRCFFHPQYQ